MSAYASTHRPTVGNRSTSNYLQALADRDAAHSSSEHHPPAINILATTPSAEVSSFSTSPEEHHTASSPETDHASSPTSSFDDSHLQPSKQANIHGLGFSLPTHHNLPTHPHENDSDGQEGPHEDEHGISGVLPQVVKREWHRVWMREHSKAGMGEQRGEGFSSTGVSRSHTPAG